jgi:4-amino-4-deoxy-L-arabinose transferase-like glycosyltransferase
MATNKIIDFYVRHKAHITIIVILFFACVTLGLFLWATSTHGIAVRTDSVAYLWSSENLVKGVGIGRLDGAGNFRPYTHWPPLYPILLASLQVTGMDGLQAARWIGAVCISLLILLVGFSIAHLTHYSPWYATAALAVLISAPSLWMTSIFAMSEPLFMILGLSALLLLERYVRSSKLGLLFISSILMGLAFATRYVGFALPAAGFLFIMIRPGWAWTQKLRDGLIMGIMSVLPFLIWVTRNILVANTSTNRTLELVPVAKIELQESLKTMVSWINPVVFQSPSASLRLVFVFSLALLASAIYFKYVPKISTEYKSRFWLLLIFFVTIYSLFTYMAKLLLDPYIPLNEERILFPVFLSFLLLLFFLFYLFQEKSRSTGWILPAFLAGIYVTGVWMVVRDNYDQIAGNRSSILVAAHEKGLGLERMVDDPFIPVVAPYRLGNFRFFTDNIELLYFLTSLNSYQLLSSHDDQIARVTREMKDHGVVLVFFDKDKFGPALQARIPELKLLYSNDVEVYVVPVGK